MESSLRTVGQYDGLFGVFVGDVINPTAPATLDFTAGGLGMSFEGLFPELQQVFFVGDGLSGTGIGASQEFFVPAGATHLYLGMLEGFGWYDNGGSFSVTIDDPAYTGTVSGTPEPGSVTMILGAGLLGLGFRYRRRMES
jgi:MYXO-CTERM domain-containing protein